MEYTALDDNRKELFTVNRVDNKGYNVDLIVTAIYRKYKYEGYYWKKSKLSKKKKLLN